MRGAGSVGCMLEEDRLCNQYSNSNIQSRLMVAPCDNLINMHARLQLTAT